MVRSAGGGGPNEAVVRPQALLAPRDRVRAVDDARGLNRSARRSVSSFAPRLDAERQELDTEPVAVAVDDQAGSIALGIDQAVAGGGVPQDTGGIVG